MRLLTDVCMLGIGTFSSLDTLFMRGAAERYKHLGRLFANSHKDSDERTIRHLDKLYGKHVVQYARNKPMRSHFYGQFLSTLIKAACTGMLILIQEISPQHSWEDMVPGHDVLTHLFFRAVAPVGGGEILNTLARYHIIDVMPLVTNLINMGCEGLNFTTKGENQWIEWARIASERISHITEAVWWVRISLIAISMGPGKEFLLSTTIVALLNRFLPLSYVIPNASNGNVDLRSGSARLFACIGSLSAMFSTIFNAPHSRELKKLDELLKATHDTPISWINELNSDRGEFDKLNDRINRAYRKFKITREDKKELDRTVLEKFKNDIRENKETIDKSLFKQKWKSGFPAHDFIKRQDRRFYKELRCL